MSEPKNPGLIANLRPFHLLTGALLYGLGGGIADYLGWQVEPVPYFLGQIWLIFLQLGFFFLGDYLHNPIKPGWIYYFRLLTTSQDQSDRTADQEAENELLFPLAALFLLLMAGQVSMMYFFQQLNPISLVLMGALVGGHVILVLPELRKHLWGFEEIVFSLLLVVLPVSLGFSLQTAAYHRFLALTTFPLYALHLSLLLGFQLIIFREDLRERRKTLLTGVGWVKGITIHNYLVIAGFFLMGAAMLFDYPAAVILPALTALLPGAYLVWYLSRLPAGASTRLTLIAVLSLVTFGLPVYYFLYSVWVY